MAIHELETSQSPSFLFLKDFLYLQVYMQYNACNTCFMYGTEIPLNLLNTSIHPPGRQFYANYTKLESPSNLTWGTLKSVAILGSGADPGKVKRVLSPSPIQQI